MPKYNNNNTNNFNRMQNEDKQKYPPTVFNYI